MTINKELPRNVDIEHVKKILLTDNFPRLTAIKYIKEMTGLSLSESKDILLRIEADVISKEEKICSATPELLAAFAETMNQLENNLSGNPFYEMSKVAAEEGSNNWYARAMAAIEKANK